MTSMVKGPVLSSLWASVIKDFRQLACTHFSVKGVAFYTGCCGLPPIVFKSPFSGHVAAAAGDRPLRGAVRGHQQSRDRIWVRTAPGAYIFAGRLSARFSA